MRIYTINTVVIPGSPLAARPFQTVVWFAHGAWHKAIVNAGMNTEPTQVPNKLSELVFGFGVAIVGMFFLYFMFGVEPKDSEQ